MHKNTLLVTIVLAVLAALVVGIQIGRGLGRQTPLVNTPTPTPRVSIAPTLTMLTGDTCGVSFQYPNTLQALESSTSGMVLANTSNPTDSIIIVCQNEIPRVPLSEDLIESVVLRAATGSASISANLYHDASQNDGTPVDKLIFTHPKTGLDVFIAGFGNTYNQLLSTLKLL
jgi:hypothetical protein